MMLYTTLNDIRKYSPCESGWVKLLKSLDKTSHDDEPLAFKTILDSNGLADTIWCLRAVSGHDKEIRLYAVWCARQIEHLDKTGTAMQTNDISVKFANGQATDTDLAAARAAARAAASAAESAATWAAASAAAWDAWVAARDAASAVAWDAWVAARDAARDAQKQEFIKQFCTE